MRRTIQCERMLKLLNDLVPYGRRRHYTEDVTHHFLEYLREATKKVKQKCHPPQRKKPFKRINSLWVLEMLNDLMNKPWGKWAKMTDGGAKQLGWREASEAAINDLTTECELW